MTAFVSWLYTSGVVLLVIVKKACNSSALVSVVNCKETVVIKHEFVKRVHKRYAKENIVIPYPVQAVNVSQEKAYDSVDPLEGKFNRQ